MNQEDFEKYVDTSMQEALVTQLCRNDDITDNDSERWDTNTAWAAAQDPDNWELTESVGGIRSAFPNVIATAGNYSEA